LVGNNTRKIGVRKTIIANSPKMKSEQYDCSNIRYHDKNNHQGSSSNKKNNLVFKNANNYYTGRNSINGNGNNIQKGLKIKIKHISSINKKNVNVYKYDDVYNSYNEKMNYLNINLQQGNKRHSNNKKNSIGHMINIDKNINNMNKKNIKLMNNIKMKNSGNNKNLTVIQNFSKYQKKGTLIVNNNIISNKMFYQNENICNNHVGEYKSTKEINESKRLKYK
jgi:hypothetical protein